MAIAEAIRSPKVSLAEVSSKLPFPVVFYLLAMVIPLKTKVGPIALDGVRLILLVLIIPLTINLLRGRYGRIIFTDWMFFLHALWMPVALVVNNPNRAVEFAGSVTIEFLGGYLLARAYIRSKDTFVALCWFLAILIIALLPLALLELRTGNPIALNFLNKIPGFSSYGNGSYEPRMGLNRTQVVFQHPIHFGLFASSLFAMALVGLKGAYPDIKRIGFAMMIVLSVFCSLSSGPLLAVVIQVIFVTWAMVMSKVKARWTILFWMAVATYVGIDMLSNRTPIYVFMSYATFSPHNAYWRALIFEYGMNNVWANPVFGLGLNDWVRPTFMYTPSVDNFWLLIAMRFGFPGFLTLIAGYIALLWQVGFRHFPDGSRLWQLRRAWMITFAGFTFSLTTVHIWGPIYSFMFFMFGAGVWLLTATEEDNAATGTTSTKTVRGHLSWTRSQNSPPRLALPAPEQRKPDETMSKVRKNAAYRRTHSKSDTGAEKTSPRKNPYTRFPKS